LDLELDLRAPVILIPESVTCTQKLRKAGRGCAGEVEEEEEEEKEEVGRAGGGTECVPVPVVVVQVP
jgi:hypothetical protein